ENLAMGRQVYDPYNGLDIGHKVFAEGNIRPQPYLYWLVGQVDVVAVVAEPCGDRGAQVIDADLVKRGEYALEMVEHRVVVLQPSVPLRRERPLVFRPGQGSRQQRDGPVASFIVAVPVHAQLDLVSHHAGGLPGGLVGADDGTVHDWVAGEGPISAVSGRCLPHLGLEFGEVLIPRWQPSR